MSGVNLNTLTLIAQSTKKKINKYLLILAVVGVLFGLVFLVMGLLNSEMISVGLGAFFIVMIPLAIWDEDRRNSDRLAFVRRIQNNPDQVSSIYELVKSAKVETDFVDINIPKNYYYLAIHLKDNSYKEFWSDESTVRKAILELKEYFPESVFGKK